MLNYKYIPLFLRDFPSLIFQRCCFREKMRIIIRVLFSNQYIYKSSQWFHKNVREKNVRVNIQQTSH